MHILAATSPWLTEEWREWKRKESNTCFCPFASLSHHLQSVAGRKCNGSVCQNTIAFFQRRREFWSPMRAGSLDKQLLSLVIDATCLLSSPIESCSPPLNAHQMPYRVEWTWKQGGEEQLQIRAGYTRSCSCWSLPTMRLFMLNEVWAFLNPQNTYPGSPFLSPIFQGHIPYHLLDKLTRHWHRICYCFPAYLPPLKQKDVFPHPSSAGDVIIAFVEWCRW